MFEKIIEKIKIFKFTRRLNKALKEFDARAIFINKKTTEVWYLIYRNDKTMFIPVPLDDLGEHFIQFIINKVRGER